EPDLPICDAHHHLWERPPNNYLLTHFLDDLASGHNVLASVAVECSYGYRKFGAGQLKPLGETEFLENVARQARSDARIETKVAAAIVGFANLSLGDAVAPVLEGHLALSPSRFRGIRYSTTWDGSGAVRNEAPPRMLLDGHFRQGFGWLKKFNLSFDAWLYHTQLPEFADLAREFPDVTIILNHIGAPLGVGPYAGKRDEVYQLWRQHIASLAEFPNIVVKLGGVGSVRSGYDWHQRRIKASSEELAEILRPYFEVCIEKLGAERCLFEGNFPVEKAANSYVILWNAYKRITKSYSASERAALFYGTAARVYRI
ncbi:MAG TPA: amidohydrolase family protein, partial [Candidatus Binatia bacterium]|nr:amidohydrolase family protein [Candidatus Binatia bacterium]